MIIMKRSTFLIAALLCASSPLARAQVTVNTGPFNVNIDIPDGSLSGLQDTRHIPSSVGPITDISVTLDISSIGTSGANNGDYYAYLTHGSGFAVLLNRPGLRTGSTIGYDDSGYTSVTFNDSAANGDVHNYRLQLFGNHDTSIGGANPAPLTGTWQPDGRYILPTSSGATFDSTTTRNAMLSSFNNMNLQGDWTLFISDVNGGGKGRLNSWSMTVTAVPEPRTTALTIAAGLLTFALLRRKFA
jgi:subtilisin-like proprotein convertase family protein